jgi:hypothetical protein
MKVFLKKSQKVGDKTIEKGSEGFVFVCKLESDSFLVNFGEIRVEVGRNDLDFSQTK